MQLSAGRGCPTCTANQRDKAPSCSLGFSKRAYASFGHKSKNAHKRDLQVTHANSNPKHKRKASVLRAAANVPTDSAPATAAIPLQLAENYYALQHPAVLNMRYSQAVKEFVTTAVTAYECGYSEDTLQQELKQAAAQMSDTRVIDQDDCLLCVCMVWMTVTMSKSTRRWSTAKPVSESTLKSWKGFVTLIVKGYMEKRWAWFPIDRLQMELTAVTGRTERPHVVAEWARVVHTTLEQVAPQFPSH